jgi:L-alanine-DL-glutamate epimerase-like enolase superfamily enzyme
MSVITGIEVVATGPAMPVVRYTDALPDVHTTVTFVAVTTDSGETGVGAVESDSFGAFDLGPLEALRCVVPALVGRDPYEPAEVAALAFERLPSASRRVPCAAVEVACWDLVARRAGVPLARALGGVRDEIPAYASLPCEAVETLLPLIHRAVADGYRAVKLHLSGIPQADIDLVAQVRDELGDLELIVDAESVYDVPAATAVGRALDELDVRWFEAPLPDRYLDGYRSLRRAFHTPVVPAGGLVDDPRELAHALRSEPWSAVRTQTLEGGIGHVREMADVARAAGLDLELCSYGTSLTQAIDLHVMLGLGLGSFYEQPYPVEPWEFGTTTPIVVEGGVARVPEGPGLGMELDLDALDDAALARFSTAG